MDLSNSFAALGCKCYKFHRMIKKDGINKIKDTVSFDIFTEEELFIFEKHDCLCFWWEVCKEFEKKKIFDGLNQDIFLILTKIQYIKI